MARPSSERMHPAKVKGGVCSMHPEIEEKMRIVASVMDTHF